jgi:regulatory protein
MIPEGCQAPTFVQSRFERSKSGPTVAQTWRVARHSSNRNPDRARPPLDRAALERLALHYLGRYATTRAKLATYLHRKLDERGWDGDAVAPVVAIVERMAELGYVDDRAFGEMRANALARRGYGPRRQADALRAAGVEEADRDAVFAEQAEQAALDGADEGDGAHASAIAFARRKRIGPFAHAPADPDARRRQLASMLRAGHGFDVARRFVDAAPGEIPDA